MSKRKKTLLMLLRGGMSQSDIAAVVRCSKRDVSAAKRAIVDYALTVDAVEAMTEAEVESLVAPPKAPREKSPSYLQPDMEAFVERKARNKRLPVKLMWYEYSRNAERQDLEAYCSRPSARCSPRPRTAATPASASSTCPARRPTSIGRYR